MLDNEKIRIVSGVAIRHNIPPANLLAIVEKESRGTVFARVNGADEPLILNEPHIFYRRLSGAKRDRAVAEGLAYERQGMKPYPKTQMERWDWLRRASAIDPIAAVEACSWGAMQVLGMHWKALGFASVEEFVTLCRSGLEGQIEIGMRYIEVNNLADELREGQWDPFARGYNGKNYRKNNYAVDLKRYAAMYQGTNSEPNGMLRMGSTGRRVREMQALLVRAGLAVKADGDFGPSTKAGLVEFQKRNGLKTDGIYGPETERLLGGLRDVAEDKPGKLKLLDIPLVKKGSAALAGGVVTATQLADAKGVVEDAAGQIVGLGLQSTLLDYAVNGLTIIGVGLGLAGGVAVVIGWLSEKKTVEA